LLDKAEKELMQPVHQKLKEALYKIGSERGYDYILNTDNNSYPFVNNQTGEDITAEAISAVSK
jgi:outer membrane protein